MNNDDKYALAVFFLVSGWVLSVIAMAANWFWAVDAIAKVCK